ncbi:hypothetical protein [Caldisphaera lagunensis]|nr:hypothetical protein [Caldisphaera lagunensis]
MKATTLNGAPILDARDATPVVYANAEPTSNTEPISGCILPSSKLT